MSKTLSGVESQDSFVSQDLDFEWQDDYSSNTINTHKKPFIGNSVIIGNFHYSIESIDSRLKFTGKDIQKIFPICKNI